MTYEYECALTGLTQEGGLDDDSDSLGDLPAGWTRIQITRRAYNPRWVMIQQVKEAMVENMVQQVPPELREMQKVVIALQVDAQFYAMESETPTFLPDIDEVVYVSDEQVAVPAMNEVRESLGLMPLVEDADDDDDEDEDEEEDDEETSPLMLGVGDGLEIEDPDEEDEEED